MPRNLAGLMHELGPEFAARAERSDNEDLFVAELRRVEEAWSTDQSRHDRPHDPSPFGYPICRESDGSGWRSLCLPRIGD